MSEPLFKLGDWAGDPLHPDQQANLSEREQASVPGVCPVRWSLLGLVNVYRRCDPVRGELSDADWAGIGYPGPVDRRPHNVGVLDGRLVLIDYDTSWSDCIACRRYGFQERDTSHGHYN